MGKGRQGVRKLAALLTGILILDGALLGAAAGVWNGLSRAGGRENA